ncbi:squamosa promoter-binding-like protein 1 isoform X1 [Physcomitrium patens]|uniref:SBP-type domain-containing protein n=1 Tax=Physcomitrium patens TaxID=3218 RepID=A0A2K1KVS9_PHYPA|nr:squamosa promoter-binding-like protein 1 isoform X2 [Physcomitrium patens]PNR57881.1 hypothetical protein PHYPA_004875 [Physcomitrium patens]|eukprot:XP_024370445.1 squamosa promoter-binding-like protein 1 isoform X2 [Physcomitrella patens]
MERDIRQAGVDSRSHISPPLFQHQFFPAGGVQPSIANNVENSNGRLSSADGGHNTEEGIEHPSHWDMKTWNWDSIQFVAQRAGERGDGSFEEQREHGNNGSDGNHRASATVVTIDRPCSGERRRRSNEEDERGKYFLEMETPSPPLNDGHAFPGDDDSQEAVGSLSLKLGGDAYAHIEENGGGSRNGKRNRSSSPQYQVPMCQVDACKADLSKAKDYYRRHKVCETHSKATKAPVSRLMQRFCQQCSRFHPLQEFDEGKRSCRRRLAGHNRRRRKTQPDAAAAQALLVAEEERLSKGGSGLIGSLLNILSHLMGTTNLDRFNAPVLDREALLRKVITASLEDINRTTPLWAQLLANPHHLTSLLGQQPQQLAASNGHVANVNVDTQHLLSRLTSPSPEALLLMLQNSLDAQIAAASITIQNNLGSQMHGASGLGNFPLGSTCGLETQLAPPRTTETCVAPTSAGVSHSLLSSPMLARGSSLKDVVRPTPMVPKPLPQLNSEQLVQHGIPAVQSSFMPYQAHAGSPTKKHASNGLGPTIFNHFPTDGRLLPISPTVDPSSSARQEVNLQLPLRQSSGSSQSGSDEPLPSSSHAREPRNWTRRIAMKLFERNPEELPLDLRFQIDSWLAHLPSDMESYIRPGCLVLTIFVSMPVCGWAELDADLQGSVQRLLDLHEGDFWHKGRILVQVERQTVLIVDGIIQDKRLVDSWSRPYIQSVRPLAVEADQAANITVKGFNLTLPDTRVLCAHRGKYLIQHGSTDSNEAEVAFNDIEDDLDSCTGQSMDLSTSYSNVETSLRLDAKFTSCVEHPYAVGRCFLEVEHDTTLANARPLIIADRWVCSELCTLEEEVEVIASRTTQAALLEGLQPVEVIGCSQVARLVMEEDVASFLYELGWYFGGGISRQMDDTAELNVVSATRLKCLLIFSVERSWCAVVRKLLDVTLEGQNIDTSIARLSKILRNDVSLLHRAVRRKSRNMVELLLAYVPSSISTETIKNAGDTEKSGNSMQFNSQWSTLFRPDISGPAGLTPLHVAASMEDGEDIVDALTNDLFQVGLHAWMNKRDDSGRTPLQYAMMGNHIKSIELVSCKVAALAGTSHQVCISIPPDSLLQTLDQRSSRDVHDGSRGFSSLQLAEWVDSGTAPVKNLSINKTLAPCRVHARRAHFGGISGPAFKPFLLSLVAIATVCVCVCILIRTPPSIRFVMQPFRWEGVDGGPR